MVIVSAQTSEVFKKTLPSGSFAGDFRSLFLHMSLHARQIAIAAGATGEIIEKVAAQMVAEKMVRSDRAEGLVKEYTGKQVHT